MGVEEEIKMLLFARWLTMCYSCEVLNSENSYWFKEKVEHFNSVVYPEYIENGSVSEHQKLFEDCDKLRDVLINLPCISYVGVLNEPHAKCENCGKEEWQHNL